MDHHNYRNLVHEKNLHLQCIGFLQRETYDLLLYNNAPFFYGGTH